MFVISLIIGFIFTPLDSLHVYMEPNGYTSLRFELYNNGYFNATYNLVVRKTVSPSDLSFQMCFHNQCFLGDSQSITVEAGSRDTIALDFLGGSETGGIDIYYLVYDQHEANDRDSVEITGGVNIFENSHKGEYTVHFNGKYILGPSLKEAIFYSKDGREVLRKTAHRDRIATGELKSGIYFVKVITDRGIVPLKIIKEKP